jgi:hypothetical protein
MNGILDIVLVTVLGILITVSLVITTFNGKKEQLNRRIEVMIDQISGLTTELTDKENKKFKRLVTEYMEIRRNKDFTSISISKRRLAYNNMLDVYDDIEHFYNSVIAKSPYYCPPCNELHDWNHEHEEAKIK